MIEFIYDDGGRAASGRRGRAGDCTVRALAILTDRDYDVCYRALADVHGIVRGKRSARNGVDKRAYTKVYREFGLTKVKLPPGPRPTYSEAHERYGDCIVSTAKHVCAIVSGALRDTHDGRIYPWIGHQDGVQFNEMRERKAQSIWIQTETNR